MRVDACDDMQHFGTPSEIVKDMRSRDFRTYPNLDAYMKQIATTFKLGDIEGDTLEARCENFLIVQIKRGLLHGMYISDAPDSLDGDAIRVMRRVRGLTIQKLAQELGVSAMAISRWESGANVPAAERHEAIVQALFKPQYQIRPPAASVARESPPAAPPADDPRTRVRNLYRIKVLS